MNEVDKKVSEGEGLEPELEDQRQKKMNDYQSRFDSFIHQINSELKEKSYNSIKELAVELSKIIPKYMISGAIKERYKKLKEQREKENKELKSRHLTPKDEIIITDKMVEEALSDEYKEKQTLSFAL